MRLIDGLQMDNDWLQQCRVPHLDVPDTVRLNFWDPRAGGKTLELVIGEHLTAEEYQRVNDRGEIWMSVSAETGPASPGQISAQSRADWLARVESDPELNDGREVDFFFPTLAERAAGLSVAYRPARPAA